MIRRSGVGFDVRRIFTKAFHFAGGIGAKKAQIHWIVSCEDLILSKLVWALVSNSELQRRDIHQLLAEAVDLDYIR